MSSIVANLHKNALLIIPALSAFVYYSEIKASPNRLLPSIELAHSNHPLVVTSEGSRAETLSAEDTSKHMKVLCKSILQIRPDHIVTTSQNWGCEGSSGYINPENGQSISVSYSVAGDNASWRSVTFSIGPCEQGDREKACKIWIPRYMRAISELSLFRNATVRATGRCPSIESQTITSSCNINEENGTVTIRIEPK